MIPCILVSGTWGYVGGSADQLEWWYPGSPFWTAAEGQRLSLLGAADPFEWSTDLGGVGERPYTDWEAAGLALRWFARSHDLTTVDVIAHSHGGQVAAYCEEWQGLRSVTIRRLITVATPVRPDLRLTYAAAAAHVGRWTHIWTPGDLIQLAGGGGGPMPSAHQNIEEFIAPGVGKGRHHELLQPARWTTNHWWDLLKGD